MPPPWGALNYRETLPRGWDILPRRIDAVLLLGQVRAVYPLSLATVHFKLHARAMLLLASSHLICLARMSCKIALYPLHTLLVGRLTEPGMWSPYIDQVQYVELTRTNQRDIAVTPKVACSFRSAGF